MEKKPTVLHLTDLETRDIIDHASVRFVHTDNMTLAYWEFEPEGILGDHAHPHEQVTNILEGVFELTVEGEALRLEPGSIVVIPPNARHSGKSITACRLIDVFYPVREDYR